MSEEPPVADVPPVLTVPTSEERLWATFCHLGALSMYIIPVPFLNIVVPLVIWLVKREQSAFVDAHGKESLNFQITMSIAALIAALGILICIGMVLLPIVAIYNVVFVILASISANKGFPYRYPLTFRFFH